MRTRWFTGVLILLFLLGLAGCGAGQKAAEQAAEQAMESVSGADVDVDTSGGTTTTTIQTEEGTTTVTASEDSVTVTDGQGGTAAMTSGDGAAVPEGFPLPVPSGATVITAMRAENAGMVTYSVEFQVAGDLKTVAGSYEQALKDLGMQVTRMETSASDETALTLAGESDTHGAFVIMNSRAGDPNVTLAVTVSSK